MQKKLNAPPPRHCRVKRLWGSHVKYTPEVKTGLFKHAKFDMLVYNRPHSSEDRALVSGAKSPGSSPGGGIPKVSQYKPAGFLYVQS